VVTGPEVTALDAAVYVIPTDAPEADGTLAWDKTTMVLVTARAGGEQGVGWSYTSRAAAAVVGELLEDTVTGRDAFDVAGAAEAMARQVRNVGRPGIAAMAISAADIALWDLKARLLGVSLAGLLGRVHDGIPVYGSGGFTSYPHDRTREQLSGWVNVQQIPRVKIKIGESWGADERRDVARVRLAREVIGPEAELYVDANGGYTTGQAVRVAAELDACGVTWFEEPVSSQDLDGLAAIRRQVRPDVGERAHRNQGNEALGQMAAQILLTAWSRLARQGRADASTPLPSVLTQFRRGGEQPVPNLGREIVVSDVGIDERPPLTTVDLPPLASRTAAR
jgi:L-alanine-DL-glutamate epimerase-like enolase superfamily enzyme